MAKQPEFRKDFISAGDELNSLSDMIRFHFPCGYRPSMDISAVLHRFHDILASQGLDNGSIMLQDHWALLHEVEGRFAQAIEHREREIELIERLFSIGGPVGPIDQRFLIRVLRTLHQDYLEVGDSFKANEILQRIQALDER